MITTESSSLLTLTNVSRHYGDQTNQVTALDNVSCSINKGELVAVIGKSGSGKSTLLTIAGGLESPSEGSATVDGHDLWSLKPAELAKIRRRHIGFVFQGYNLLSGLTAAENITAPLELDGMSNKKAKQQAMDRLEEVDLADRADAFPDDLSGGEQQRVAIARALVGQRRLLLADEPTGALDSTTGDQIMGLLKKACTKQTAVIVVTHDQAVAAQADRTISLHDGRLVADTANNAR